MCGSLGTESSALITKYNHSGLSGLGDALPCRGRNEPKFPLAPLTRAPPGWGAARPVQRHGRGGRIRYGLLAVATHPRHTCTEGSLRVTATLRCPRIFPPKPCP